MHRIYGYILLAILAYRKNFAYDYVRTTNTHIETQRDSQTAKCGEFHIFFFSERFSLSLSFVCFVLVRASHYLSLLV